MDLALRAFVASLRPRALAEGVRPATFDRETAGLTYDGKVVRLDRAQPGGMPGVSRPGSIDFAPYRRQHVDQAHIVKGQRLYAELAGSLNETQRRTGVPGPIALSIFGHETGYGSFSGNYDLIRSFATLAFDGRRRDLFTAELIATLKLIDRGFSRVELKGSWAGATGYPQFLPSVYLRLGTDGDGDGRADIWTDRADALASIAAYLQEAGWKPNTLWGVAATVPADFDRASVATKLVSPRCPRVHARLSRWLTVGEWKARGITVTGFPAPADGELARLIEPDGPAATAYLLTANYGALLDYNCSNFYGLAAGLLADEIAR
ncbi:lytic murein transglycosylase [Sphingomonas nostoxanthinifaciens]|uniref:lytic murein transglycosylase n=1 Tax=Sphingomonas nostoxanthinifaciens TaxID=2872652 RepID=UPI001CC1ED28|nr:lytic murein transglycosylase [Sphingomonas nostoxanthinifaciens]